MRVRVSPRPPKLGNELQYRVCEAQRTACTANRFESCPISIFGRMAELVDATDLKSVIFGCAGSTPASPTKFKLDLSS